MTNVGQLFEILKEPLVSVSLIFQNQRTPSPCYFQNHKELMMFMKDPIKKRWFSGWLFEIFILFEDHGYIPKLDH
jgi:hypothetical protein